MVKLTKERENIILEYIKAHPTKSSSEIARILKKANPKGFQKVTYDSLKGVIAKVRRDNDLYQEQVKVSVQDDTKWQVISGKYEWKASKGEISLDVNFVDQLFYEYSEYGCNLTQTEIINKYNLKVWQWHSIKNVLELYKKSNIFSPYTVENTPKEELAGMIKEKMDSLMNNTGYQVVQQYNKAVVKKYKEEVKTKVGERIERETILLELQDLIPQAIEEVKPQLCITPAQNDKIVSVFIFDIHYGAEIRLRDEYRHIASRGDKASFNRNNLPDYSPEICEEMMATIAHKINSIGAKEVHLFFGGDNIETFTGLNHTDAWKGIAKGFYGARLIFKAYKALVKMISSINNVAAIYAVPGNHDRSTEKRDHDGQGFIAEILFELINLSFGGKIPVKYEEKVISETIDGVQYLMTHGHLKMTDINPAELVLEYGDPHKFNLLTSGHWHTRKLVKDSKNFRHISCPSLFPGNDYSVNNGWLSCPGFIVAFNGGEDKPTVIDYPLQ